MSSPIDATLPSPEPQRIQVQTAMAAPDGQAQPGANPRASARIGRYAILRLLGQGGMGVVYATYDEELDRKVAVKLLRDGGSGSREQRLRILREAQAMARVSHPNVVNVYEVGEVDDQVYIAMEFVEGTTLSDWQRGQRGWAEILRIYHGAGTGLLAAHEAGLVHRDFKPDNVLLGRDGRPRVADFGLARSESASEPVPAAASASAAARASRVRDMALDVTALAESGAGQSSGQLLQSPLTEAGAILGTPAYMSPEQHDGQPTDARSDQFSFCAALYEALYHQRPFPGETLLSLSFNVLQGRLRPPPAQTAVPARIERALRRGLSVDPAARFPSMRELLHEIDIDPQRDPAGAPLARRLFSLACVGTLWINTAMTSAARMNGTLTVRNLLWADLVMLLIALSVIKWQRKTLMRNAFHRGLVSVVLVTLTQTVLVRAASEYVGFSVEQVLTLDMLLLSGMFALIAAFYLRGAWVLTAISLVASLAHLLPPKLELALISTAYPVVSLGLVWLWDRAAGGQQSCVPSSQSAT